MENIDEVNGRFSKRRLESKAEMGSFKKRGVDSKRKYDKIINMSKILEIFTLRVNFLKQILLREIRIYIRISGVYIFANLPNNVVEFIPKVRR